MLHSLVFFFLYLFSFCFFSVLCFFKFLVRLLSSIMWTLPLWEQHNLSYYCFRFFFFLVLAASVFFFRQVSAHASLLLRYVQLALKTNKQTNKSNSNKKAIKQKSNTGVHRKRRENEKKNGFVVSFYGKFDHPPNSQAPCFVFACDREVPFFTSAGKKKMRA